jgi:hypothetical protein
MADGKKKSASFATASKKRKEDERDNVNTSGLLEKERRHSEESAITESSLLLEDVGPGMGLDASFKSNRRLDFVKDEFGFGLSVVADEDVASFLEATLVGEPAVGKKNELKERKAREEGNEPRRVRDEGDDDEDDESEDGLEG